MDFTAYPFDTQKCNLEIESFGHTFDEIRFVKILSHIYAYHENQFLYVYIYPVTNCECVFGHEQLVRLM